MNGTKLTTKQAHDNLTNVLIKGRILLNEVPLTHIEATILLQGEQMLFEKAMQFDKTSADDLGKIVKLPNVPENDLKKEE